MENEYTELMNDLFVRINQLEKENETLKADIIKLEEENEVNDIKNIIKEDKLDDKAIIEDIEKINSDSMHLNIINNQDLMKEVEIVYVPFDNLSSLHITGDFTNWEKIEMKKELNKFSIKLILLRGFKYYYCFYYNDDLLLDFDKEIIENPNNKLQNNLIYIPNEKTDSNLIEEFQSKDYQTLISKRNDYYKAYINNEDEFLIFDKIVNFSNLIKEHVEKIAFLKEDKISEIKYYYDEKLKKIDLLSNTRYSNYLHLFVDHILTCGNAYFLIKQINIKENLIKGVHLYDKNSLKVNIQSHFESNHLEIIQLKNVFDNIINILTKEESESILAEHASNENNILKIYYQLLNPFKSLELQPQISDVDENNMDQEYDYYLQPDRRVNMYMPSRLNKQKEIIPYKILPDNIDINEYDIEIKDNKITSVRHRDNGLNICFEAILIKEEKGTKITGLISSSSLKVYTSLYSKDIVNILHIHLNDTSEEIAVESIFLEKNENFNNYKKFDVDAYGKKLNYKFIFRDYKLIKIFYNVSSELIDEPPFEEIRITKSKFVKIIKHDIYNYYYAKIINIPIGMLARKDKGNDLVERLKSSEFKKDGYCKERHLEELPGFVDVEIAFLPDMNIVQQQIKISVLLCNLISLSANEEISLEKKIIKNVNERKNNSIKKLNNVYDELLILSKKFENEKLIEILTIEDLRDLIQKFEKSTKDEFVDCLDETEYEDKFNYVVDIKDKILPLLHQQIRILLLTNKNK